MDDLDVPIFQKVYTLYRTMHGLRNHIAKQDRHTLWLRCENNTLEIIESLLTANGQPKETKIKPLEHASIKLNLVRILVRLAKDTKTIDNQKYLSLAAQMDEIGRMLGGWIKTTKTTPPRSIFQPPNKLNYARDTECRTEQTPRLSLRLSSQLLLMFRPSRSKLPT